MTILEIKKYPDPILKKKAEEVLEVSEEIRQLMAEMIETLKTTAGVGLAAPQVGESKRIIIVQTEKGLEPFINPKILEKSREIEKGEEGCLSFPTVGRLKIRRAKRIEVEAINKEKEKIKIKAEGLMARIFQHEIDHLDGISFIQRASLFERLKARKALKSLEKQWRLSKN